MIKPNFFKSTLSALATSAILMLALLSSGCDKDQKNPASNSIVGTWSLNFFEEEFGGDCSIEYTFMKNGELTMTMSCYGEKYSLPMLWHTDGDMLFTTDSEDEAIIQDSDREFWPCVKFKVSDNILTLYGEDETATSFKRVN